MAAKKKTEETYIDRMKDEFVELNERTHKLQLFFGTDTYFSLDDAEQRDLIVQYHSMFAYLTTLRSRLVRKGIDANDLID